MKRSVVFDLDGTLVDSLPGIAEGVNRALACMGRSPLPQQAVRGMIGQGARNLCAQALGFTSSQEAPPEMLASMHEHFRREYPHCWQGEYTRPYAGVRELLHRLAAGGTRLAVLSNKPQEVTLPMVQALFPEVPFDPIMGYTGDFPRKPAPDSLLHLAAVWGVDAAELTLVGDSLFDARTAQNAGCGLALVTWGYACTADLRAWGAPVASDMAELGALLTEA